MPNPASSSGHKNLIQFSVLLLVSFFLINWAIAQPVILPIDETPLEIMGEDGSIKARYQVEIAATSDQRATGLMFREGFGGEQAMLFDFNQPRYVAMWMKNTPSPLDMLFASPTGEVLAIETGTTPFSMDLIAPKVISLYVVELGAGEVISKGIEIGDQLLHPHIKSPRN